MHVLIFVDNMMRNGKYVVVSYDTKSNWTNCSYCTSGIGGPPIAWKNSNRLMTYPADTDTRVGPFEIRRLGGPVPGGPPLRQGMTTNANGTYICIASDPLMNVNLIRHADSPEEFTFMQNGDNRCEDMLPGLRRAVGAGWRPTLFHRIQQWLPAYLHDNLDHETVKILPDVKIYPGHEYEWGHKGGHPGKPPFCALQYLTPQYDAHNGIGPGSDELVKDGSFFVMTWGESIECGKDTCGPPRQSVVVEY